MIRYTSINEKNNKNNIDIKILAINIYQVLQKLYIMKKYFEKKLQLIISINIRSYIQNLMPNIFSIKYSQYK